MDELEKKKKEDIFFNERPKSILKTPFSLLQRILFDSLVKQFLLVSFVLNTIDSTLYLQGFHVK